MSLSDLELVAQAMAPTDRPAPAPTSNGSTNGHAPSAPSNPSAQPSAADADDDTAAALAGLDLSSLNAADRAAVQPILDALRQASSAEDGDVDVEDILKQLEAADDVADKLEGRLDSLLASLGELEAAAAAGAEGEAEEKEGAEKKEAKE